VNIEVQKLRIDLLRRDGGTQPRALLDQDVAEDYSEDMAAGATFPPVIAFYDGSHYWLADGFHRVYAHLILNREEIEVDVRQGTREDAQWFSFGVNHLHGLRRTNEDKQRSVKAALLHPMGAGKSDRQLAIHVGVDHVTIKNWRDKLGATGEIQQSGRRTGADGRTINIANIGRANKKVAATVEKRLQPTVIANSGFTKKQISSNKSAFIAAIADINRACLDLAVIGDGSDLDVALFKSSSTQQEMDGYIVTIDSAMTLLSTLIKQLRANVATERSLESPDADPQTAVSENGRESHESDPKPEAAMEEIGNYQCHPATRLFPRMTPEEFAGLVDSIRSNGLIQPIARLDGLILDGRERLRACLYAGVEPSFEDLPECDSPVSYIMSKNGYRQHLTPAEIAAVKAKLLGLDSVT
jgi:hypothetical protein